MNGTNIVFDTCAIVKLLDQQYDLATLGININEARFLTSVIVRMELLAKPNLSANEELDIRNFLDDLVVVPIDDTVEQKAIEIRRATSTKLPDSIVAATAIALNATLLTDDLRLLKLSWPGFQAQGIF
jgi:predicted nucleic acid-binding protein